MLKLASVIVSAALLAGCQGVSGTATVKAECLLFKDPGFSVKGETDKDQRWVSRTQETGIGACGWPRPKKEK